MNRERLAANVYEWSKHWGILEHSNYYKQIEYFFSERSELFTTNDVEDSFGDQMVCLINASYLIPDDVITCKNLNYDWCSSVESALAHGNVEGAMGNLEIEIKVNGLEPWDCYQKAWDAIKGRALLMINGKLVKWDNLTHPQRLEVARTGGLDYEPVDLAHCKSLCTRHEWSEIKRYMR